MNGGVYALSVFKVMNCTEERCREEKSSEVKHLWNVWENPRRHTWRKFSKFYWPLSGVGIPMEQPILQPTGT